VTKFIQVLTTVDSKRAADRIALNLLHERIAACVQIIGPIDSKYWWKSRIEQRREWLCIAKARANDYRKIEATIKMTHPYTVPEILSIPVSNGNTDYLEWVKNETSRNTKPGKKHLRI